MRPTAKAHANEGALLSHAVDVMVRDHLCIGTSETVVITVDAASDMALTEELRDRAAATGAKVCVLQMPQLPLQGLLADPHIPEPVGAAAFASDVWIDLSFPYLAGSTPFARAMENGRTRYILLGDLTAAGMQRLYGKVGFGALFDLQEAADRLLAEAQGQRCRITSPAGTDIDFVIGRPATRKDRQANRPGAQTVPGSAIFYPEVETVRGVVALEAAFHDIYEPLVEPVVLEIEGTIRSVGTGTHKDLVERALRRAAGGRFGHAIHFTIGLNPAALDTGSSFIEDIRVVGRNAVGLGLPWWLPGGGENHPDGVVKDQSLWVGGIAVLAGGRPVAGHPLQELLAAVEKSASASCNVSRI